MIHYHNKSLLHVAFEHIANVTRFWVKNIGYLNIDF